MLWWPRTDLWPAAENVITSIVNISEEELPIFSDPGCIWGGGGPSASWEMSPLRCSHWYRPDHSHPGGGDNYNEPHKIVSHHDTKTRCIRAILVYNNSSLSIALVISSPIISVLHPMYHHYPWSVWRVSQDTLWMNHCLPLSVNLRHNNCLERERALLQHCTCLWCLLPFCHPLPLISRWMPPLLTPHSSDPNQNLPFRGGHESSTIDEHKEKTSTLEKLLFLSILICCNIFVRGQKWVSSFWFKFSFWTKAKPFWCSDKAWNKMRVSFLSPGIKACNFVHHQRSMENKRWISSQHSGLCSVTPI